MAYSLLVASRGIQFPDQGSNPGPRHWECRGLATGPPGKFLPSHISVLSHHAGLAENSDLTVSESSGSPGAMSASWKWVCQLSRLVAVLKYHRQSSLNNRNMFSHSSGGWESEIKVGFREKPLSLACRCLSSPEVLTRVLFSPGASLVFLLSLNFFFLQGHLEDWMSTLKESF